MTEYDVVTQPEPVSAWDQLACAILNSRPGLSERLGDDAQAHLELVSVVASARSQTAVLLTSAVQSARRAGCTWAQIGDVLGITRQAAQQQYGGDHEEVVAQASPVESMVLMPVTAFDEMSILGRAGQFGWHCVGYGPLYLRVERDERQWQHARTIIGNQPGGEGWQRIGWGWGWWRYWARPLDLPALGGNPSAQDIINNNLLR